MRQIVPGVCAALAAVTLGGCDREPAGGAKPEVVIYCALDQTYSEPILKRFEQTSGIAVQAVYDTEAAKTTGLVNRLLAERQRPQADLFWNNEIIQTVLLKQKGLLAASSPAAADRIPAWARDADGTWYGLAARARVIVYNTRLVAADDAPTSIRDLTDPKWNDKAAVAYPLFGTTRTHAAQLFASWGPQEAQQFFKDLMANGVAFVDGNATVRNLVAQGRYSIGLTDTDDVNSGIEQGMEIAMVFPDQQGEGTLLLPTTVAMIKGAPHPDQAAKLMDYILSDAVEAELARGPAAQIPLKPGIPGPKRLPPIDQIEAVPLDAAKVVDAMPAAAEWLQTNIVKAGK